MLLPDCGLIEVCATVPLFFPTWAGKYLHSFPDPQVPARSRLLGWRERERGRTEEPRKDSGEQQPQLQTLRRSFLGPSSTTTLDAPGRFPNFDQQVCEWEGQEEGAWAVSEEDWVREVSDEKEEGE